MALTKINFAELFSGSGKRPPFPPAGKMISYWKGALTELNFNAMELFLGLSQEFLVKGLERLRSKIVIVILVLVSLGGVMLELFSKGA